MLVLLKSLMKEMKKTYYTKQFGEESFIIGGST